MARIISIVNQKGGTGKSACTANLAVGLAQKNMKVLIVDADPQSDVSAGFGYRDCDDSNETLTALMDAVMKDEDIPSDCYIRHQAEGIDIICSNIGLAGTEVQLVNAMSREYVLKQILYGIKDQYDAVIIDCMPSLGMITINALAASDEVLIPVEASYLPIKGLQQLLKTIGKVRKQINPKLQVGGILFTMVDAHTNDARNNLEYEDLDPMSIISSAILENGFSEYMRKRKNTALMTVDEWLTAFEESAFDDVMIKVYPTSSALFINANANKYKEYLKELEEYVRNSLVQYMLPQEFITFAWFPLSQNGKVDRKKIRQIVGNRKCTMVKNTDYVGVEREIAELWKEMLSVEDIGRNDNFFEIGGDSLLATQFVECLKQKYEIEMSLREIFNNAELDRVSKIIEEKIECNKQMIEGEI